MTEWLLLNVNEAVPTHGASSGGHNESFEDVGAARETDGAFHLAAMINVAATLAGALSMIANMAAWGAILDGNRSEHEEGHPLAGLLGVIVAPIGASLIQLAISRSREFIADAFAEISGNPLAFANALRKIGIWSREIPLAAGSPATAHLFIVNPFSSAGMSSLFRTYPTTAERIVRLEALASRGTWAA